MHNTQRLSIQSVQQEICKEFVHKSTVPYSHVKYIFEKMHLYNISYLRIPPTALKANVLYPNPKFLDIYLIEYILCLTLNTLQKR